MSETNPTPPDSTPPRLDPHRDGPRTNFEKFLDKNPELKAKYIKARETQESYRESDIANLDDVIEYLFFELTRAKNEDVLRGKTFTDYTSNFIQLCKYKVEAEQKIAETDARCKKIINDRTEIETFMKIIYEALTETITDINTRKNLSDKIQTLYDKYYPTNISKDPNAIPNVQSGESAG